MKLEKHHATHAKTHRPIEKQHGNHMRADRCTEKVRNTTAAPQHNAENNQNINDATAACLENIKFQQEQIPNIMANKEHRKPDIQLKLKKTLR